MKKIDKCLCGGKLEDVAVVRDGIHLLGQKCVKLMPKKCCATKCLEKPIIARRIRPRIS